MLKQKLLNPILQTIFPVLVASPPPGELDPEDEDDEAGEGTDNDNPKHCAAQVGVRSYRSSTLSHRLSENLRKCVVLADN